MTLRVTRLNTDVAGLTDPTLRVTRLNVDVAGDPDPTLRVTRLNVDAAGLPTTPDVRLYRYAIYVLMEVSPAIEETASNDLIFTDTNDLEQVYGINQNVIFDDTASAEITLQPTAEDALVLSQDLPDPGITIPESADNGLAFTQEAHSSLIVESVIQSLIFDQYAATTNPTPYLEHVVQTLLLTDEGISSLQTLLAQNGLVFTQQALKTKIIEGGLEYTASGNVIFTDTASKVKILADAIDRSATHSLIFTDRATLPVFRITQQTLIFMQVVAKDRIKQVEHDVIFTDEASAAGTAWDRTATNGLLFTHAIVWEDVIDTCNYSPNIGEGTGPTPPASTMPTLVPQNYVRLFYPTTSPTLEVNIRTPEFGNRERLQFTRINRESRGGTLQIFADPTWPKSKVLALTFTGLTETQAQAVQTFFTDTLGLEIGLTDWEGRTWHGIVTTPDADLVRSRRGRDACGNNSIVDLSFEFEGELQ